MRYLPCWKQIGITKERYLELLNFCRQYPEWKMKANSMIGTRSIRNDGIKSGNTRNSSVEIAVEKRERVLAKMAIVEECAKSISEGKWYSVIMQHICYQKSYAHIDPVLLPTSDSNTFYKQRRLFFEILDKKKD